MFSEDILFKDLDAFHLKTSLWRDKSVFIKYLKNCHMERESRFVLCGLGRCTNACGGNYMEENFSTASGKML